MENKIGLGGGDLLGVQTVVTMMMEAYCGKDILVKARSVIRQFSYGDVEYKGRGWCIICVGIMGLETRHFMTLTITYNLTF